MDNVLQIWKVNFPTEVGMGSPVSPTVMNMYLEDLEQRIIATAPEDCKPRIWKRYTDDVIFQVHTVKADKLQQHVNIQDSTGSIVVTREDEENNSMDAKFTRKKDRNVGPPCTGRRSTVTST